MKLSFVICSILGFAAKASATVEEGPNANVSAVETGDSASWRWNHGMYKLWKNKKLAITYLDALFTDYNVETASSLLTEDHIQHNWLVATGSAPILGSIPFFEQIGMTYTNHRIIAEGDMVVTHNTFYDPLNAFGLGESFVTFDLYRVEGDKLAEHWDIIISETPPNPSGNTLTNGPSRVENQWYAKRNKARVLSFVEDVLINEQLSSAAKYISSRGFIQHSPTFGNGLDAFVEALEEGRYAGDEKNVRIVVAEGNYVFVAMELENPGEANTAVFDLFRVQRGNIAEQWSLLRFIPEESEFQHDNGFF